MTIAVGAKVPKAVFPHIPYTPELENLGVCGTITTYDIEQEWAGKKVVVFAVPGAFTPTCHVNHLPGYLKNHAQFLDKGVDVIAVIAANDPFVMSGWARVEGLKDKIVALTDTYAKWSASLGLTVDLTDKGLGVRTTRYALVLDDLVVKHVQVEAVPGTVQATGADSVLALL